MSKQESPSQSEILTVSDVQVLEQALGITADEERFLEASLLVDAKFLDTAAITGQQTDIERLFGEKAWSNHLKARLAAREYGRQPLTVDFIVMLHKIFLEEDSTESIQDSINPRGGRIVGNDFAPLFLTDKQIEEVASNFLLAWRPLPGHISEGYIAYQTNTRRAKEEELDQLITWYNEERDRSTYTPYELAAYLQRIFICIHPLSVDYNGRVSRILLNWSLENEDISPSMLDDFDADMLTRDTEWAERVKNGSQRYATYKKQLAHHESDLAILRGVQQERSFYLQATDIEAPLLHPGKDHDHDLFSIFLEQLRVQRMD